MAHNFKEITELPANYDAEMLGLVYVTDGTACYLQDGKGNEYRTPPWLRDLLSKAHSDGRDSVRRSIKNALGIEQ